MDFRIFILLFASISTIPATDIYLPSLPGMTELFAVTASAMKDSIALYQIGSLLSALVLGFLSDRFGRKPLLIIGLSLFFLGSLACTFTHSFFFFMVGRFLEGAGAVSIPIIGWAMIHDTYPKEEGTKIMSFFGIVYSGLPLISPTLGGFIDVHLGWHWDFAILSIGSALTILLLCLKFEDPSTARNNEPMSFHSYLKSFASVFRNKIFLAYVSIFAILLFGEWCYLTLIPFYLEHVLNYGPEDCGFFISAVGIAYILGALITPKLLDRFGIEKTIGLGVIISLVAACFLIALTLPMRNVHIPVAIAICAYLFGLAITWAPSTTKSLQSFDTTKGTASSIRSLIFTIACASGVFLASFLSEFSLIPLSFILFYCALSALLIFKYIRSIEKKSPFSN